MATTEDKIKYANSAALTITLASLAASATVGRQATVVDNSASLYDDVLVSLILTTGTVSSPVSINVYVAGSEDGNNFDQDDAVMGASDAGYTINANTNLRLAKVINAPTSSKIYNAVFSLANLFGGVMPRKWTIVVVNNTGGALAASGNAASYTGITYTNG